MQSSDILAEMLGRSLGASTATAAVNNAVRAMGFGHLLSHQQALDVLEYISQQSGIVGIAARFAKSRVHLHWGDGG